MKTVKFFRFIMTSLFAIFLAAPPVVLAEDSDASVAKRFSQEELDQILAPVALYPDSLLAHVLMAATYPLEIVMADRWVKQNKNLTGDPLIEAADKQQWDPSVKALVPFPELLSTMAEKLEWTDKLGDAFLAQQTDVMETVQSLRNKAYEAGNLKSTNEQNVIVERETILVEPADPRVVYVPVYDPWLVYGAWWWPYYPPYVFYPYPYPAAVYYPGYIGFSVGFVVSAYWGNWGYCNWPYRTVYVNPYYHGRPYMRYRSARVVSVASSRIEPTMREWTHNPHHRRGVEYRDSTVRSRFGQARRTSADNRRVSRTFEDNMARMTDAGKADAATRTGRGTNVGRTSSGRGNASIERLGKPEASVSRTRPDRAGAVRAIGSNSAGNTTPTIERSGRVETSSTARKVIEQGAAPSASARVNRLGRDESVSAPKAQNWNSAQGGRGSVGSASSRGGVVGSGGGRTGGWSGSGGGDFSRGGARGQASGGMRGGSFHGGR
jgi:hypothetical protein